jgi:hypothetical protein
MNQPTSVTSVPIVDVAAASFNQSDKHTLFGETLQPWTPDRIIAGQSMGMMFPMEVDWERFKSTRMYPGSLRRGDRFERVERTRPENVIV